AALEESPGCREARDAGPDDDHVGAPCVPRRAARGAGRARAAERGRHSGRGCAADEAPARDAAAPLWSGHPAVASRGELNSTSCTIQFSGRGGAASNVPHDTLAHVFLDDRLAALSLRPKLSREEVFASQRGRMLEAIAASAAEKGYAATTLSDI